MRWLQKDREGVTEVAKRDYVKDAIKALERACELDPRNGSYQLDLGRCLSSLGDSTSKEQAIKAFQKASQLASGEKELAGNAKLLESFVLVALHRNDEAELVLAELVKTSRNAKLYDYLGRIRQTLPDQQSEKAIEAFEHAVALDPDNALYRYNLGRAHFAMAEKTGVKNQLEPAIKAFREAFALAGNNNSRLAELALIAQGEALRALNNRDEEALAAYKDAAQRNPGSFSAWNGVGLACEKLGKFKDAVDAYQHAIKQVPNSAIYYYQLGRALDGSDQRDQAIEAYRQAAELDGQHNGEAIFSLGDALVRANKLPDAAKVFDRATRNDAKSHRAFNELGKVQWFLGKYDDAAKSFQQAADLEPESPIYNYHLGVMLETTGRPAEAIERYHRAAKADGDKPGLAILALGDALIGVRCHKEAVETFERAVRIIGKATQMATRTISAPCLVWDSPMAWRATLSGRRTTSWRPHGWFAGISAAWPREAGRRRLGRACGRLEGGRRDGARDRRGQGRPSLTRPTRPSPKRKSKTRGQRRSRYSIRPSPEARPSPSTLPPPPISSAPGSSTERPCGTVRDGRPAGQGGRAAFPSRPRWTIPRRPVPRAGRGSGRSATRPAAPARRPEPVPGNTRRCRECNQPQQNRQRQPKQI